MKVIGDLRLPPPTPLRQPIPVSSEYHANMLRSFLNRHQLPLRQLHLERALLPDDDDPAPVHPVLLAGRELVVEAEEEPRDGDPQLRVGQVLAQAVPRAEAEGVFFWN